MRVCCDTSLVSQLACSVSDCLDVFALFAHFEANPFDGATLVWATTIALGSRFACRAQATPRVDVDVTRLRLCVSHPVSLQVPGTHNFVSKTSGRFQVFVKGLAGRTVVVAGCTRLTRRWMILWRLVAMCEDVLVACFYLVGAGSKVLRFGAALCDVGVNADSPVIMVDRLRGGSSRPRPPPVPGSWHCYVCDMGVCWPKRNTCYRCLASRGTVPQPHSRSKPPRENQFPGRSPQPSGGVNPTYRKPAPPGLLGASHRW